MPAPQPLDIAKLRTDGNTQAREKIDCDTVEEYAEHYRAKTKMPPVVVFFDGQAYWLADGFHRVAGARGAGRRKIESDVRQGTQRDAILFSLAANHNHGLRRSNADKRKAVLTVLQDEEWSKWTDRRIAEHCGVSQPFVSGMRPDCQKGGDNGYHENDDDQENSADSESSDSTNDSQSDYEKNGDSAEEGDSESPTLDLMRQSNKRLEEFAKRVVALALEAAELDEPHLANYGRLRIFEDQLKTAAGTIRAAKGAGECIYCEDDPAARPKCKWCRGTGWLDKQQLESAPRK